ncbi:MAG: ATP-binding protein, partial [Chloroflexota bacterium]
YRGKAIEAVVRAALDEMIPDARFAGAASIGAYWTADNAVEVDLVGADRRDPPAKRVSFIGSIKWRDGRPLSKTDHSALIRSATRVSGADATKTRTVAVSPLGANADATSVFDVVLDADDILGAWPVR